MVSASARDPELCADGVELLRTAALPEARLLDHVWLVDEIGVCFTTKAPISGNVRARTGLTRLTETGTRVYRIIDGWPVLNPAHLYQGPVAATVEPKTWVGDSA